MSDAAAFLASLVLLGLAAYRVLADRSAAPDSTRTAVYGFVICEGLAMALLAPASTDLLGRAGVSALCVVLVGDTVRTAAVGFLMLVGYALTLRVGNPPRFVVPAAVLVQAAMIAAFLTARPVMIADGSLVVHGTGRVLLSLHDALFGTYAIWCLAVVVAGLGRESRRASPGRLRVGLRLALAAACVGVVWSAWTADDVIGVLRSGVQDGSEDITSNVLGAVCAALVVAGATVAKWGESAGAPLRWLRAYRTCVRLAPLWEALHAQLPHIALAEPRRGILAAIPSNAEFALYRRVIEIDDGRLALRPYTPPRSAIAAALPLSSTANDALYEAVAIAAALANLRAGRRPEPVEAEAAAPVEEASGSVHIEAAWLLEVAAAFHSPAVRHTLYRLDLQRSTNS